MATFAFVLGVQVLRFEMVVSRVDWASSILQNSPNGGEVIWTSTKKALDPWTNRLGFALIARAQLLAMQAAKSPLNIDSLEEAEVALIVASPTLSTSWQALAELRLARGNTAGGLAAWRISRLTGGHEGYLMVDRATLGLLHWQQLVPDGR
ncbi:hypothetical protein WDZ92_46995, partial [Nostoc sp. NIES-2111]